MQLDFHVLIYILHIALNLIANIFLQNKKMFTEITKVHQSVIAFKLQDL